MNKRKRQVIEASLQLFIEKGFKQTSIQDILEKAHISKGTFYNYFSSKNECLLSILEQRRYEASLLRNEMLLGQNQADIQILIKQTTVFAAINQKQNLMTVFEEIFHSGDSDLKKIVSSHKSYELEWLTGRLIDVFGEEARPYAYECAVLFLGIKQHLTLTWRDVHDKALDPQRASELSMRYTKAILAKMIETKDVLLDTSAYYMMCQKLHNTLVTKEQLIADLQVFQQEIQLCSINTSNGVELCEGLLEELSREHPRYAIIQALLQPFRTAFENTPVQTDAQEICNHFWTFLQQNL